MCKLTILSWAKPQDIIDQEDEERLKIKLNRPNALYEEFATDLSNWNRIIERSKKNRNKPYLHNGWVEYHDEYSGVFFMHREPQETIEAGSKELNQLSLDGGGSGFKGISVESLPDMQVSLVKPRLPKVYRKMFFWQQLFAVL